MISGGTLPLVLAGSVIPPLAILVLCAVAGLGTLLLLPSCRGTAGRVVGGLLIAIALLILTALVIHVILGAPGPTPGLGAYFWIFSTIAIFGAIRVVTHPRPVYSALYFVMTVFASAGLFVLLAADFLAAALVLIYAGAILVTYVFVIMLASQASTGNASGALLGLAEYDSTSREPLVATCIGFIMLGVLTFLIFDKADGLTEPQPLNDAVAGTVIPASAITGPTQALGEYLFHHQLVNVELAGLILTLAMVGSIMIARRKIITGPVHIGQAAADEFEADTVLGPATPINDDPHSIPVIGTRNKAQKAYPET